MIFFVAASVLLIAVLGFIFLVRPQSLPPAAPVPPDAHLQARKRQIYENLRDLAFEYRVGKLSDDDYQRTKQGLQSELAGTLAQIDEANKTGSAPPPRAATANICPHCKAKFDRPLKFCGECGKAMA